MGDDVKGFSVGDEVIGFSDERSRHAELVVVDVHSLVRRPKNASWEQAGSLFVVGTTAYAAIRAIALKKGETVVVSGAAGSVGSVTVQLAKNLGATVIGLASDSNREWLEAHGVVPMAYGEGVEARIRAASGDNVDAFIDTRVPVTSSSRWSSVFRRNGSTRSSTLRRQKSTASRPRATVTPRRPTCCPSSRAS